MKFFLSFSILISIIYSVRCDVDNAVYSCNVVDRTNRDPNRCETINDIVVEERVHNGNKIWCIVINNDAGTYNDQNLEIGVSGQGYGVGYSFTLDHISMDISKVVFKLSTGVNKVALYAYEKKPFPSISSIILNGKNLCGGSNVTEKDAISNNVASNSSPSDQKDVHHKETEEKKSEDEPTSIAQIGKDERYRFLNDCIDRPSSLETTTFCSEKKISPNKFIVEKFDLNGEDYWCLSFGPEKSNKSAVIKLSNPYTGVSWVNKIKSYKICLY